MANLPMPENMDGDALEAFSGQPGLFTALDVDAPTVQAARGFLHTGSTVTRHEQDAARIVAAATLGWSARKIARELKHSRNTVSAVLRLAEQAGKVEPVAKRVLAAAAAAVHADIEAGNDLRDVAETPQEVSALAALRRATWVGAGILADKGAPASPAPITVNVSGSVVQVVQDYAAKLRELDQCDSVSIGQMAIGAEFGAVDVAGDVLELPARSGSEPKAAAENVTEPTAARGGGGVGELAAGNNNDGNS